MGALRGFLFLLMAFVVNASEDYGDILQKELSFMDILEAHADEMRCRQEKSKPPEDIHDIPKGQAGRAVVMPRSIPSVPSIPFPPARPTHSNRQAICRHSSHRPRYPKDTLPSSGYGYLYRQAHAVNQLESWFSECCSGDTEKEEMILCCLQQAWKQSLSDFCEAEFMVKTSHYHCCKKKEEAEKWQCFETHAPHHSYQATDHKSWTNIPGSPLKFNPSTCQKTSTEVTVRALRGKTSGISFPPGRPNSANIGSVCANRKQRPRYIPRCLPSSDYDWLGRQSKAVNGLEKGLSQCCKRKKDQQPCAERKWKKMVDRFCKDEKTKAKPFECCQKEKGDEQYDCFAAAAPNPDYVVEEDSVDPSAQAPPTLDMLCVSENVTVQGNLINPADVLAARCCPLVDEKRPACFQTEIDILPNTVCDVNSAHVCCLKKAESRSNCFTKMIMKNVRRPNKNRKCPISS
ncbi:extracellular matrix protein 1 [Brachyhypopomus gauderio]|uniref:extracellular matrix protein 1 n=1 Tax=Brachyhypopomus gauderio TaxID=698409 RepID=UPI004042AED6